MPYDWPEETDFAFWELDVLDRKCPTCGRMMHVCDHRYRRFHTLQGPVELLCRLDRCPDPPRTLAQILDRLRGVWCDPTAPRACLRLDAKPGAFRLV